MAALAAGKFGARYANLNAIIKKLKYLWRRAIYGGSTKLKPYEQFVLNCVVDALSKQERSILELQLANLEMIQRSPGMRISRIFLNPDASYPLFDCVDPASTMARLKISGKVKSIVVEVMRHKGEIASLEFHGSPERLGNDTLYLKTITLNPESENVSVEQAINRLEHGKQK